jgi:hypothetical protein
VDPVLSDEDVERFVRDGAIRLERAFPPETADECRQLLWSATGCDEHDPRTWTRPVIRIEGRGDAPFVAAANTKRLRGAFDQLAGTGYVWAAIVTQRGCSPVPADRPSFSAPPVSSFR